MAESLGNVIRTSIDNMKLALQQLKGAYVKFYFTSPFQNQNCSQLLSSRLHATPIVPRHLRVSGSLYNQGVSLGFDLFIAFIYINNYGT